jgi:PHD/YefM family antitoxin component YafN of YafNO toxin-antitoxin module
MLYNNITMKSYIPISQFNKGEAGKIFRDLQEDGIKIVLKNNTPTGVLLSPKEFDKINEMLEDYALLMEAQERMNDVAESDFISAETVMQQLGVSEKELGVAEGEDTEFD